MFDHVKVNQNSLMNLVKVPERVNSDILSRKPGNDFFAMVMEKSGFEDKKIPVENKADKYSETRENNINKDSSRTEQKNNISESEVIKGRDDRSVSSTDRVKNDNPENVKDKAKDEIKAETEKAEPVRKPEASSKEKKVQKSDDESSDDEITAADQLHEEKNMKTLLEIIKAAFNENKKSEEENLQKLFSNIKFKKEKEGTSLTSFSKKNETDKNHKAAPESLSHFIKDLKDLISKEITKGTENRKSGNKPVVLNDKELKELAVNIIEGMKKSKAKEIVKHEVKIISGEELKSDKKLQVVAADDQLSKKMTVSDDNSSDKNGAKDKNSGKENFSYNSGKLEFSSKSGIDRVEHSSKMPDFRETLQEIIDKAKVSVRDSRNGSFTVKLNPQELGNVNVNLVMENGVITGKFLVDNEDVKSMLLNSLNDLKTQMEEAGIAVGEFSVNVEDQREKYLKQKDDEELRSLFSIGKDKEVIAAAEQYNSNSAAHTGHINMVI